MARRSKKEQMAYTASLLRFLGDESRYTLLRTLLDEKEGLYVHEVAELLNISHSAASHQCGALEVRGVVERIREGQHMRYKLSSGAEAKLAVKIIKSSTGA